MKQTVGLVIIAQNAQDSISILIEKFLTQDFIQEIIIIDDGSTDHTLLEIQKWANPKVRLFHFDNERGRSAAIALAASKTQCDILATWPAHLEYDTDDLISLVSPILEERVDVVWGSRFMYPMFQVMPNYCFVWYHKSLSCWNGFFNNKYLSDILCEVIAFEAKLITSASEFGIFNIGLLSYLNSLHTLQANDTQEEIEVPLLVEVAVKSHPLKAPLISFSLYLTYLLNTFEVNLKRIFKF